MPTRTPRIPDADLARIPGKALYRMASAGAEIVIGGDHATLTLPEARAAKWGGECWLRVRHADADEIDKADKTAKAAGKELKAAEKASIRTEKGKPVLDIPVPGKRRLHEIREGSLKWDVIYDDPSALPADGIERFQLEFPDGLTWHYQPALTAEEIAEGAERPDNVVGSYAGYWNQAGRYLDKNGEEIANYETGKFAHLYRPEMVDAAGNRCWAEQELVGNELRVTLPAEWMAAAVYPVRLDPTFGYESVGSTLFASGSMRGTAHTLPVAATINSMTVYHQVTAAQSGNVNAAIYEKATAALLSQAGPVGCSTVQPLAEGVSGWGTIPWPELSLAAGDYVLVFLWGVTSTDRRGRYDAVSCWRYSLVSAATTPPDPWSGTAETAAFLLSAYATYTESGGGGGSTLDTSSAWQIYTAAEINTAWAIRTALNQSAAWAVFTRDDAESAWSIRTSAEAGTAWTVRAGMDTPTYWTIATSADAPTEWQIKAGVDAETAWPIFAAIDTATAWRILEGLSLDAPTAWSIKAALEADAAWSIRTALDTGSAWAIISRLDRETAWQILGAGILDTPTAWAIRADFDQATAWAIKTSLSEDTDWTIINGMDTATAWDILQGFATDTAWQVYLGLSTATAWSIISDTVPEPVRVFMAESRDFIINAEKRIFILLAERK